MQNIKKIMKSYNGFSPERRAEVGRLQNKLIKEGVMSNPMNMSCEICGQDKGIRTYHNEDYSEEHYIDNARVVCWRCHMMIHTRYRHPLSFARYMIDTTLYHKRFAPVYKYNDWETLEQHYID